MYIIILLEYKDNKLVETIKKNNSRSLKRKFEFLRKQYIRTKKVFWEKGYFVFTVEINEEVIQSTLNHNKRRKRQNKRSLYFENNTP